MKEHSENVARSKEVIGVAVKNSEKKRPEKSKKSC